LTPVIALWRFGSLFETPTPNRGVHLGVWGLIPSHSLHSREHVECSRVSHLARNLATPCLGREPKARVATFGVLFVCRWMHDDNVLVFFLDAFTCNHNQMSQQWRLNHKWAFCGHFDFFIKMNFWRICFTTCFFKYFLFPQ
jgi:hypothetical protein